MHGAVLSPAGSQKSSRSHGSPPPLPVFLTPVKLMCCGENEQKGSEPELGEVREPVCGQRGGWRKQWTTDSWAKMAPTMTKTKSGLVKTKTSKDPGYQD